MAKKMQPVKVDEALVQLAYDQRVELIAEWHRTLEGLGVGLAKYKEKGWKFSGDDIAFPDPSEWRRVGKLCYLLAQLQIIQHDLTYQASTRPLSPLWCVPCRGEFPTGGQWLKVECLEHNTTPANAATIANWFWEQQ